jgi:protein TonB
MVSPKESELIRGEEITEAPGKIALAIQEPDAIVKNRYIQFVAQRIQESLVYPSLASKAQFAGSLRLGLCLYSSGQLLDIKINKSSGSAVLDENTLRTVKEITPFSPFPPEIKDDQLCVDIPIVYSLKQ